MWAHYGHPCVTVGDHDANCGRMWTPRRDIVGAHVFCVGVCGRARMRAKQTPNPKGVEGDVGRGVKPTA